MMIIKSKLWLFLESLDVGNSDYGFNLKFKSAFFQLTYKIVKKLQVDVENLKKPTSASEWLKSGLQQIELFPKPISSSSSDVEEKKIKFDPKLKMRKSMDEKQKMDKYFFITKNRKSVVIFKC